MANPDSPYEQIILKAVDTLTEIQTGKQYKFNAAIGGLYYVELLQTNAFKFIPFFIKKFGDPESAGDIYYHIFNESEDNYYKEENNKWFFKNENDFVFRKKKFPTFEIDKWVANHISADEVDFFLCDSLKPALGSFSERLIGMHARLTDGMRDEMVGNLNSIYYGIEGNKVDLGEGEAGGGSKTMTESLSKPTVHTPPGSSPYALRGEHIRRSLLNRGVDATETIDQVMYPWEQDFALNQVAKWTEKIKAMVYSVVGALITTQVDRRTVRELKPSEWEIVRKEKPGFWKNGDAGDLFRIESCAGPIWDSGDKKMKSVPSGDKEYSRAIMYNFLKKIEQKFNAFKNGIADDTDTEFADNFSKALFGPANEVRRDFNMKAASEKLGIKEVTDLENVNDVREFFSNEMIKEGVFSFKTSEESAFAENTFQFFLETTNFEKNTVNLIYKNSTYPHEGFSYELQTLSFGPSNSFRETFFSIGHGVNLLTEGTEIAASFLQYSSWAQAARLGLGPDDYYFHTVRVDENKVYEKNYVTGGDKKKFADFVKADDSQNLAEFGNPQTQNLGERYVYYKERKLAFQELAVWLSENFLGYCYERPHVVDKPMFAKLVNPTKIEELCIKALGANFVKTTKNFLKQELNDENVKIQLETLELDREQLYAQSRIFYFMKHESESQSAPKARRMENIIQPYLVSVTASSVGTGIQSFMHMEDWWGAKPDYYSVEAEGIFILKQMATERFRKKRKFGGGFRFEGSLGEWFSEQTGVESFSQIVMQCKNQDSAAAVVVRLIEAIQAANEAVIDGGRTQRDKEGRQYVNQARFSYAMQLLEMKKETP